MLSYGVKMGMVESQELSNLSNMHDIIIKNYT